MTEKFTITSKDIGRHVRQISTGEIDRVRKDPGNGWVHPGVVYEWQGYVNDLEYVEVFPSRKIFMALKVQVSEDVSRLVTNQRQITGTEEGLVSYAAGKAFEMLMAWGLIHEAMTKEQLLNMDVFQYVADQFVSVGYSADYHKGFKYGKDVALKTFEEMARAGALVPVSTEELKKPEGLKPGDPYFYGRCNRCRGPIQITTFQTHTEDKEVKIHD